MYSLTQSRLAEDPATRPCERHSCVSKLDVQLYPVDEDGVHVVATCVRENRTHNQSFSVSAHIYKNAHKGRSGQCGQNSLCTLAMAMAGSGWQYWHRYKPVTGTGRIPGKIRGACADPAWPLRAACLQRHFGHSQRVRARPGCRPARPRPRLAQQRPLALPLPVELPHP